MPWIQSDVDNLRRAIAEGRGARSIGFSDQTIVFNSIDEMLKLLAIMEAAVLGAAGTRQRYRVATTSKGV